MAKLTQKHLDALKRLIDMPMNQLRHYVASGETTAERLEETRGMTRGDLIVEAIEVGMVGSLGVEDDECLSKDEQTDTLLNCEDRKCVYGYMTLCAKCRQSTDVPSHVDVNTVIHGFPATQCEMCKGHK